MISKKFLTSFMASGLLLFTACSNENVWNYENTPGVDTDTDYVDVTFSVNTEDAIASRATSTDKATWEPTIGQGKQVDRLIYAVYEVLRDESLPNRPITGYTILEQYGLGYIDANEAPTGTEPAPSGQTIVEKVGDQLRKEEGYTFTLRLMRNKEYCMAFWAHNSTTDAFDTDDLTIVEVKYDKANNNDEYRDAFCKSHVFSVIAGMNEKIWLTRPFAQINVGTTGADFRRYLGTYPNATPYFNSKVILSGASKYIDVVRDKILTDDDLKDYGLQNEKATTDVTFNWAELPAYIDMEQPDGKDFNALIGKEESDEEFLRVKLDYNYNGYKGYLDKYPTIDDEGKYLTETFKYFSMCYVLVPAAPNPTVNEDGNYDLVDAYKGSTLSSFDFYISNNGADDNQYNSFNLTNVPVHRNWRTNILSGLSKTKYNPKDPKDPEPEDPEDPDPNDPDPNPPTIFPTKDKIIKLTISMSPTFDNSYNSKDKGSTWENVTSDVSNKKE